MPNDKGKTWKAHCKKAALKVQKKECLTCKKTKNIKEFAQGGGTYRKKDNCRVCSPDPEYYQCGTSRKYKDKKKHVAIRPAYIQPAHELIRSVCKITDQEQIEIKVED